MFSKYKNFTTENVSYKSFVTEASNFLAEIQITNKSNKNITEDVNICHALMNVINKFEWLFKYPKDSTFTKIIYEEILDFISNRS